jgi:hypothetical protein
MLFVDQQVDSHYTNNHHEKSCPLESHYPTTRAQKELIYNFTKMKAWKYEQINK